ncbi:unnamed protein product [Cladocopium goreaui]|uniref:Uncharacterized protein n=1 Tax=Cladocopium goreaui TaxID=2562237 RepID=A0A9P1GR47_9DINO|nr:unnamed protein product [Cladocopium goreaui]
MKRTMRLVRRSSVSGVREAAAKAMAFCQKETEAHVEQVVRKHVVKFLEDSHRFMLSSTVKAKTNRCTILRSEAMLRKTQRLRAALPGLVRQWHRLTRNGRGFSTGEVQSRSGSSLAGVVGGFAVGAITAGATAYYFLQAPSTPPEKGATKVKQEIATPVAKEKPQAEKSSEAKAEKVVEVEQTIEMEKTEKTIVESTKEVVPEPTPEEIEEANKKKEMLKILQVQSAEVSSLASNALQQVETAHQSSSQRREAALARLKHVLEVGDMSLIAEALAEAKAAAVPSGAAEMMLAEGLGVETSTQIEDLLDMAEEFRVEPQQARAAELERCQGKSRKELEQRLVELTRMLASARLHSKARLEQALQTKMTQHELQALKALYTSLKEAEKDFDQAAEVEFQELKQELRKQQEGILPYLDTFDTATVTRQHGSCVVPVDVSETMSNSPQKGRTFRKQGTDLSSASSAISTLSFSANSFNAASFGASIGLQRRSTIEGHTPMEDLQNSNRIEQKEATRCREMLRNIEKGTNTEPINQEFRKCVAWLELLDYFDE